MVKKFQHILNKLIFENIKFEQNIIEKFKPESKKNREIHNTILLSFFIILTGKKHKHYKKANEFFETISKVKKWKFLVDFYLTGVQLIQSEITNQSQKIFENKLDLLIIELKKNKNDKNLIESFWSLFFPEGKDLFNAEKRRKQISDLRGKRKIKITELNNDPIKNPAKEILFTSNILFTIPMENNSIEFIDNDDQLKDRLVKVIKEKQKYWYDHPIPVGIETEYNEAIYGLSGLSQMLSFEKERGNAAQQDRLDCVLSVSVTHTGLHRIAKNYFKNEIDKSAEIENLNIYLITESDTQRLILDVLKPIAENYLNQPNGVIEKLSTIFGVDGEYGRHYSFLKAISAFWQVFIDNNKKATFKIDLDQVFPQEELVEQTKSSAFEHFKSPLWGAAGKDVNGNDVNLGMIAGALVNESDIKKSLFYPDICFPIDDLIYPDEWVFNSKLPQAQSTEAEMMIKYNSDEFNGKDTVISRVHVTGGTNGILIESLKKYRPFTPSFIGRAEDQAYLMSVLFDQLTYLRYLHKPGLIMRHDKQAFAGQAIKAAEVGKLVGDYIRILLFSYYAKILPWSVKRIKSELDPFTGCFVSNLPLTVVYLRFTLKALFLLNNDYKKGVEFLKQGSDRLIKLIKDLTVDKDTLFEKYRFEKDSWNLYYEILKIAEIKLKENDMWMIAMKDKVNSIMKEMKI